MAIGTWKGGAVTRVAQTTTLLISSNTNTHTFIVSLANPTGIPATAQTFVTVTADGVLTTAQLAAAVVTAWQALNHDWVKAITAQVVSGSTVTFTANVPGVPYVMSKSGTGTSTLTTTVANSGQEDFGTPSNFTEGIAPASTYDVMITGNGNIKYGLNQAAIDWDDVFIKNYGGTIGAPSTPLACDPDDLEIDFLGTAYLALIGTSTIKVMNAGYLSMVSGASHALFEMFGGMADIGVFHDATMTITNAIIHGGTVNVGPNVAVTNLKVTGGTVSFDQLDANTLTLVLVNGGIVTMKGEYPVTTATVSDGQVWWDGTGTCTTLNIYGGEVDATRVQMPRTFTTVNLYQGGVFKYDSAYTTVGTFNRFGPIEYSAA